MNEMPSTQYDMWLAYLEILAEEKDGNFLEHHAKTSVANRQRLR